MNYQDAEAAKAEEGYQGHVVYGTSVPRVPKTTGLSDEILAMQKQIRSLEKQVAQLLERVERLDHITRPEVVNAELAALLQTNRPG